MARELTNHAAPSQAHPAQVILPEGSTPSSARQQWQELTKARLSALVVLTTAFGFLLSVTELFSVLEFLGTLLGTALVAVSSSALNQLSESHWDALMTRTSQRPIPTGQLSRRNAFLFAIVTGVAGSAILFAIEPLAAALALTTLVIYVWVYTPLKRRTTLNTLVGAIPGALPPLIGWAAARGELSLEAWSLFAILFLWQVPHFLAIAWLHREDYARAGFHMLSVNDPGGQRTGRMAVQYLLALIVVSLFPAVIDFAGMTYAIVATILGVIFLVAGVRMSLAPERQSARRLFFTSLLYLPLLFTALMLDLNQPPEARILDPRVGLILEADSFDPDMLGTESERIKANAEFRNATVDTSRRAPADVTPSASAEKGKQ